jgi:hypothetical protein
MKIEIAYLASGHAQTIAAAGQDDLQVQLKKLLQNGAVITEVRRMRLTLEETFVNMALRGGKK